jgi:hypothetical protein
MSWAKLVDEIENAARARDVEKGDSAVLRKVGWEMYS